MSAFDLTTALIGLDEGTLTEDQHLELFQYLVDTNLAWQLQGRIGREAAALIDRGLVTPPAVTSPPSRQGDAQFGY